MNSKPGETPAGLPPGTIPVPNPFGNGSYKPNAASFRERFDRYNKTHEIIPGKRDVASQLAARTQRDAHPAWLPEFTIVERRSGSVIYEHIATPIDASTPDDALKYVCETASQAEGMSLVMALFWLEANVKPTRLRRS